MFIAIDTTGNVLSSFACAEFESTQYNTLSKTNVWKFFPKRVYNLYIARYYPMSPQKLGQVGLCSCVLPDVSNQARGVQYEDEEPR